YTPGRRAIRPAWTDGEAQPSPPAPAPVGRGVNRGVLPPGRRSPMPWFRGESPKTNPPKTIYFNTDHLVAVEPDSPPARGTATVRTVDGETFTLTEAATLRLLERLNIDPPPA